MTLENGLPVNTGTLAGHEIGAAGTTPALPVKSGDETVPIGVNEAVEFVPDGVIVSTPPPVPTLPFAATVPRMNFPLSTESSVNPVGQAVSDRKMRPEGITVLTSAFVLSAVWVAVETGSPAAAVVEAVDRFHAPATHV